MSQYAFLTCPESGLMIWLGKAVFREGAKEVEFFQIQRESDPRNTERELLTRAVWKFLADHVGKELRVKFDWEMDSADEFGSYREIGEDIPFEDYLSGWRG